MRLSEEFPDHTVGVLRLREDRQPAVVEAPQAANQPSVLPPAPPMVSVRMDEYRFDMAEETLPAGRAVFSMANIGEVDHRLSLISLPEDFPPIHEQVRSSDNRVVQQLATIPETPPGDEAAFAVDLQPGRRYGLACLIADADGKTHAEKGMVAEFRIR